MGFKNFRIAVTLRLVLFSCLVAVSIWGLVETDWQVTPIVAAILAILVLLETIRYVEFVNRDLASFLDFIVHNDFSARIPIGRRGRVFEKLQTAYETLLDKYRNLNQARELNHLYLESLVEHVNVALLCLDDHGKVTLMNREAKRLFMTPLLSSLASLARIDPALPSQLEALADGERALIRVRVQGEPLQLASYVTEFQLLEQKYRLISFQNIRDELERREIDFSQKLIKVLTHEIMNSVTPIIALCKVIERSLAEPESESAAANPAQYDTDDLLRCVASIQSRGDGLLRFVQAYRSLTSPPTPKKKNVDVGRLLEDTVTLIGPTMQEGTINLQSRVECDGLAVEADPDQLQQVLINLVNNAIEAINGQENGEILLSGMRDDKHRTVIKVSDNGPGIPEEQLDDIFVPFFTTKRKGTGVGLSVSRQIMFLNRGLIAVNSSRGEGTEFLLQFSALPDAGSGQGVYQTGDE